MVEKVGWEDQQCPVAGAIGCVQSRVVINLHPRHATWTPLHSRQFRPPHPVSFPLILLILFHLPARPTMGGPSKYRRLKIPIPNLTLGISIALWALLTWVGYWCFSIDQAASGLWGCEMAYMYPSFLPLKGVDDTGSRYALYLYREGGMDPPAVRASGWQL